AKKLGIDYPKVERHFETEADKKEHALRLNLCRRQTDAVRWGQAFKSLLKLHGVERKPGRKADINCATVAQLAEDIGVPRRTAEVRLKAADDYEAVPKRERKYSQMAINGNLQKP
ncbi:MAG TPA: hypothetical protein VM098_09840, partial [Phycisphaerae bacterium]|nr:hypothetical protein [Phycisphaerae bacterium]